jgi:hypothetical protein
MTEGLKRFEIINLLARRWNLRTYLEICTPSTGFTFAQIDAANFTQRHRLVYQCPRDADDGQIYTYRTVAQSSLDISRAIRMARDDTPQYDIVFLDPWHTYQVSLEDLQGAWDLIVPGGWIVVHDCSPPDLAYASPNHRFGGWCGETYRAWIDFLAFRNDATFCTVDSDYGCGVARKLRPGETPTISGDLLLLWLHWRASSDEPSARYAFFDAHRSMLLQLVSSEEFIEREQLADITCAGTTSSVVK